MKRYLSDEQLLSDLCAIMQTGAYGQGKVSLCIKDSSDHRRLIYGGCIYKVKGTVTAEGRSGRTELLRLIDNACHNGVSHSGSEGILKINVLSPASLAASDSSGFMRFERPVEIIYEGV